MAITRLDFSLPELFRIIWVSAQAREVWEPRISRISRAWESIERKAVAFGIKPAALQVCSPGDLPGLVEWALDHELVCVPLGQQGSGKYNTTETYVEGKPWEYRILISNPELARIFVERWREKDNEAIGAALGFPQCCRDFFEKYWVGLGWTDLTLPQALHEREQEDGIYRVSGPIECNTLLRGLGLRLVSHLPCSFDCPHSAAIGQRLGVLGLDSGFAQEMDWLTQILNWPIEWSSLHGVAVTKTPAFKLITDTTAIATQQVVQRDGPVYPEEGARGVEFPFREVYTLHVRRKDEHSDNGFGSRGDMDKAHEPILQLVAEATANVNGSVDVGKVIDLGCGNGLLLEKIVGERSWLKPCGVEQDKVKCDRAYHRLRLYGPELRCGSIYDEMTWNPPYSLALVSVQRLLEVGAAEARLLLKRLHDDCGKVVIYSYEPEKDYTLEMISEFFKPIIGYQNQNAIAHLLAPKVGHA